MRFIVLWALAIFLIPPAWGRSCATDLSGDLLTRLENSIAELFEVTNSTLDRELALDILPEIEDLSAAELDMFFRILKRPLEILPQGEPLMAAVFQNPTGLTIGMKTSALRHRLGRLLLRHELAHVLRFVSEAQTPEQEVAFAQEILDRPLGVYREETIAFRAQYRWLRKIHTHEDILELRRNATRLTTADWAQPESEKLAQRENDLLYLKYLEKAFALSESEFIKEMIGKDVEGYLSLQRKQALRQPAAVLRRWLNN